jgi:predicted exporter
LRFDTDVLSLLPRSGRVIPAFREFVETFGSVDQLYVVFTAPEGHGMTDYDDAVQSWVDHLRQAPEIARVDTGRMDESRDLSWLADRRLLLLDDEHLSQALDRFSGDGLHKVLQSRRALLAVPSPALVDLIRHDPLGIFDLVRDQLGGTQAGVNFGMTEGGYVTPDSRHRLLIARPVKPPFDAQFSRALGERLERIRTEVQSVQTGRTDGEDAKPPVQVEFAGGHRIAVETEAVIRRESISNSIGSLALILPLLFIVFRSGWLVSVGAIPTALSLIVTLGLLGLARTTLATAAAASSAMLFGLGVDGVVLLYMSYTLAMREGATPAAAIEGMHGSASSMLLGMWTTAATFYGLLFVDFPSLEQLGTVIGHSMVLCGLLTLFLVPALLPRRQPARPARYLSMPRFATWVERRGGTILAIAIAVTIVLAVASVRLRINPTLDRLRSVTPGAELLQQIGPMFGLADDVSVVMTSGTNLEDLLTANERLRTGLARALPAMTVQAPSMLLPSAAMQAQRQAMIHTRGLAAASAARALTQAELAEGFKAGSFDPFRERLSEVLATDRRLTPLTYDGYLSHGLDDLIGRFIARKGDRWLLATYAFPSTPADAKALERTVTQLDGTATLTGLTFVNRELADRFLPEFLKGLSIGTVIVVGLVLMAFRDWRLSLLSLAPTGIGLIWAAGLLAIAGAVLDLFALFAVVTFVGIGVDYGVHLVHRFEERGHATQAVSELAPVILVAAAITLLGYGTLVTSSYPPLRSIGLVSTVSVATLAAASLFVLPAMLARQGKR